MPRTRVERCLILDLARLAAGGALRSGASCSVSWGENSISTSASETGLTLTYAYGEANTPVRCVVSLEWTPATVGGPRVYGRCPGCWTRVVKLYKPPWSGQFRCRGCYGLTYASRQEARPRGALHRFFDALELHERSQWHRDPEHAQRMEERAERTLARVEQAAARWLADPPPRPRFLVTRGRGRPSKAAAREYARLQREAWTPLPKQPAAPAPPEPKRPRGRPREKRPYTRRAPLPPLTTPAGEGLAYCVTCRDRRELSRPRRVALDNGRPALRGNCCECGRRLCRFLPSNS